MASASNAGCGRRQEPAYNLRDENRTNYHQTAAEAYSSERPGHSLFLKVPFHRAVVSSVFEKIPKLPLE